MKDLIDILCWFVGLLKGFIEILGLDGSIVDDITGKLQGLVTE